MYQVHTYFLNYWHFSVKDLREAQRNMSVIVNFRQTLWMDITHTQTGLTKVSLDPKEKQTVQLVNSLVVKLSD